MGKWSRGGITPSRKTCSDVIDLLTDYMDGGLAPPETAALEKHLSDCAACTEYLRSLKSTTAAVSRLRRETIPEEVRRRLRSFIALRPSAPWT